MNAGFALGLLGVLLVAIGIAALYVAKRTGEVHSLWFGEHPENIERFEKAYFLTGVAAVATGLFVTMLGAGSMLLGFLAT